MFLTIFILQLLAAVALFQGIAKHAAADAVAAAATHAGLAPRYNYDPGDQLNRTMCFCTSDNSLQQTDNDPTAFFNTSVGHRMAYMYEFVYFNHAIGKSMILTSRPKTCYTRPSDYDPYYHNACVNWRAQHKDFCATYEWPNGTLAYWPPHPEKRRTWRFCYLFRGDDLIGYSKRDFFTFDGGKRGLPRKRDYIMPEDEVKTLCEGKCKEAGMEIFESKYGGWFSRSDGFHVGSLSFFLSLVFTGTAVMLMLDV
ncbi:MAG: hypothetical protein Q9173_003660 [Seirophora scorigena]